MKKFYTVFDKDEKVIGFSVANQMNIDVKNNIVTPYDDADEEIQKKEKLSDEESVIVFNRREKRDSSDKGKDDINLIHP